VLYFDNIDAVVNGTGILVEQATISSQNYLDPAYILEKRGELSQPVTDSIRHTLDLSYFVEVDNEPNLEIVNSLKQFREDDYQASPYVIEVGGVSGEYFLQDYRTNFVPNKITKASVTFVGFTPTSGYLQPKKTGVQKVNYNKSSSFSNGWTTFASNSGNYFQLPTLDLQYNFRAAWNPIYTIGSKYPKQVQLLNASELAVFTREEFHHVTFSGQPVGEAMSQFSADKTFDALTVNYLCDSSNSEQLSFDISGSVIVRTSIQAQVGDVVRTKVAVNRNY